MSPHQYPAGDIPDGGLNLVISEEVATAEFPAMARKWTRKDGTEEWVIAVRPIYIIEPD